MCSSCGVTLLQRKSRLLLKKTSKPAIEIFSFFGIPLSQATAFGCILDLSSSPSQPRLSYNNGKITEFQLQPYLSVAVDQE